MYISVLIHMNTIIKYIEIDDFWLFDLNFQHSASLLLVAGLRFPATSRRTS